jgi:hypothetical protein
MGPVAIARQAAVGPATWGLAGRHNRVIVKLERSRGREQLRQMPSLFRFLTVLGMLGALVFGGLYAVGVLLEPEQGDMSTSVLGVKVRRLQ